MSAATYNGDGLRTSSITTPAGGSAITESYLWDTSGSLPHLVMDSQNAYIYGPGNAPIEQVKLSDGTITYLVADRLGSVRGTVNASGALTNSTSYDAWGNPQSSGGLTSNTPFGYAASYTGPTGLNYNIRRYYDPQTGQFISVDPVVDQTGLAYAYAGEDPVNHCDALGLAPSCQGARKEGNFGYIATQVSPKGRLQIGAYPWQGPVSGIWSYQVWVNGRAWHRWWIIPVPKVQTYPPHWSIKRKNAPPGSLIHINVNYMGPAGIANGNLYCVMPLLSLPPGAV